MLIHKPLVEVAFDGRHCGLLLNHRKHFVRVASVHINLVKQVKGCAGVFILGSPFGVLLAWVVPSPHEHLNVLDLPSTPAHDRARSRCQCRGPTRRGG